MASPDHRHRGRRVERGLAVALVALTGVLVFLVAAELFPYHSVNDDEGVYLTAASMLLDGQLFLYPGSLGDLVRPWFFITVERAGTTAFYPKYAPVVPAVFAVGGAVGSFDLALALVAAGNAALVYLLAAATFDRRAGLVAVVALVASPLFLFSSAVFLPYAPTLLFELGFAAAYVRAWRRDSLGWAALAGVAVGVAFFARPYTAVLFAAPFVGHTLWALWTRYRNHREQLRPTLRRALATALPGAAFVGVALGYNAVVTGDPLLFPYAAFAPADGIGFGRRELLGYDRLYTPALAARTTLEVGWLLATRWLVGGPIAPLLGVVGVVALLRSSPDSRVLSQRRLGIVILAVVPTVVLGNAYFWGTLNGLSNGLIDLLGPFYHFDLLLPTAVFVGGGATELARRTSAVAHERFDRRRARVILVVLALVALPVIGAAQVDAVDDPYAENRLRTENLADVYEPFRETAFDRAVVFVPDPYGDWLNHPFQRLRNQPGFDGEAVYVLDEGAADDFRALDATSDRRPYRFTYRGAWVGAERAVESTLTPLDVRSGERITATTTVGVPPGATSASVRLESGGQYGRYAVDTLTVDELSVEWSVDSDGARVRTHRAVGGDAPLALPNGPSELDLVVTFVDQSGASVTYRQTVSVDVADGNVSVIWPPETRICRLTTTCGTEGTYVGPDGDYLTGVSVESTVVAVSERDSQGRSSAFRSGTVPRDSVSRNNQ